MPTESPDEPVPHEARYVMQQGIWHECIAPGGNEWTTWSDAITLAEAAADALSVAGFKVVKADG